MRTFHAGGTRVLPQKHKGPLPDSRQNVDAQIQDASRRCLLVTNLHRSGGIFNQESQNPTLGGVFGLSVGKGDWRGANVDGKMAIFKFFLKKLASIVESEAYLVSVK
jgi:hypothetical protein